MMLAAAALTAGASIYGARQNASAARRGAAAIQQGTDQSIAEARRQFDLNRQDMQPFIQSGNRRLRAQDQLLGLGGQSDMAGQIGVNDQPFDQFGEYVRGNADLMQAFQNSGGQYGGIADFGRIHYDTHGRGEGRQLPTQSVLQPNQAYGAPMQGNSFVQGDNQRGGSPVDPLAGFRQSAFYQIDDDPRIRQGTNAAFSAKGMGLDGSAQVAMGRALQSNLYGRMLDFNSTLGQGSAQGAGILQNLGQQGMNMAGNNANLRMGAANAMASSFQQQANARNQGLGGVLGAAQWLGGQRGWF